jgi:hypothetical protein
MIRLIKNWWYDTLFLCLFDPAVNKNMVTIQNAFIRRLPSHLDTVLRPEIVEWLQTEIEGYFWHGGNLISVDPTLTAEEVWFSIWFSRPEDAIKFKLTFS